MTCPFATWLATTRAVEAGELSMIELVKAHKAAERAGRNIAYAFFVAAAMKCAERQGVITGMSAALRDPIGARDFIARGFAIGVLQERKP